MMSREGRRSTLLTGRTRGTTALCLLVGSQFGVGKASADHGSGLYVLCEVSMHLDVVYLFHSRNLGSSSGHAEPFFSLHRDSMGLLTIADSILPALAFSLDMFAKTDMSYGVNEVLLASVLGSVLFSVLAAQPLTIVGVTGPITVFNYTVYDIMAHRTNYFSFMCWIGL